MPNDPPPKARKKRRGTRRDELVTAAREILVEGGEDAMTMRAVADRVGIRAPSIYKHFPDKEALVTAVAVDAMLEFGAHLDKIWSRVAPDEVLAVSLHEYRRLALANPNLYRLMTDRPLRWDLVPPGLAERYVEPLARVAGSIEQARAAWAFAHGMVSVELARRFPPGADLDRSWELGIAAFAKGPANGDI